MGMSTPTSNDDPGVVRCEDGRNKQVMLRPAAFSLEDSLFKHVLGYGRVSPQEDQDFASALFREQLGRVRDDSMTCWLLDGCRMTE
ncbi:hypothetical protein BDN67DRAFT_245972 [Paxillus ammoniavirescens]|nr:hypothetical protein BDN67DRAFT_245972 [Paxillus ammoniavirescens]